MNEKALEALFGALGWAVPICLAAIAVFYMFKPPITRCIERVKRFNLFGQSAEVHPEPANHQQIDRAPSVEIAAPSVGPARGPAPSSGLLSTVERHLEDQLEALAPNDLAGKLRWAVRTSAEALIDRENEVTYRLIFGSQIAVLKEMNIRAGTLTIDQARNCYEFYKARYPDFYADLPFEQWTRFLIGRRLVAQPEDAHLPTSLLRLTDEGRQFLMFLTAKGVWENKPG